MKNILHLAILLTITCSVRSQSPSNSHCLNHSQLKIVYEKTIKGEQCEQKLDSVRTVVKKLRSVVVSKNDKIQKGLKNVLILNDSIANLNEKYTAKSVELQAQKDKKRPWWEWAILGLAAAAGYSIAK